MYSPQKRSRTAIDFKPLRWSRENGWIGGGHKNDTFM